MNIHLVRFCSGPFGAFSKLLVEDRTLYTVEKPWCDNKPMVSCVPLGEYDLIWRPTTTSVPDEFDGHTWYLLGETVGIEPGDRHRYRCAIHRGNTDKAVSGCIAPGLKLGDINGRWAVMSSNDAMLTLLQLLGPGNHTLSINNALLG